MQPSTVPLIDLTRQYATLKSEIETAISKLCTAQTFILGAPVSQFESEIATWIGTPHAIGCASGTDALYLALLAYGIGHGDEVITVPFTFIATAGAISRTGATPVFVDIDPGTFNIDVSKIEAAITPRTKAIVPVHLYGQCADMDPLMAIAKAHNLVVIEDACQSIGSTYNGRPAGTLGHVGCFSFFPTKNLGGFGDGGLMITSNPDVATKLAMLRVHGSAKRYYHDMIGIASRLDALQAAVLSIKLPHLKAWTDRRNEIAEIYRVGFAELASRNIVQLPQIAPATTRHVYNQFVIRVQNRDELIAELRKNGIGCEIYYPLCLHQQVCYTELNYQPGDFPAAENAALSSVALPIFPELTQSEITRIIDTIISFYA